MEIVFDNKNIQIYKELLCQTKQVQEITESVVPDTDEDIAKIAAVQSSVLLKSKDVTSRGVLVTGEAVASLMYITEGQNKVSFVKMSKGFSIEYDLPNLDEDVAAQINLSVLSAEARVVNPRKVSVCFEISGEISCYHLEELSVESGVQEENCPGLHAKYESERISLISAVCEKTFSLGEQFSIPSGKPRPVRIISGNAELNINDTQPVGTKVIVKGNADISLCYISDEVNYPVKAEFSTAFSQIVDIGDNAMENCSVMTALTAIYFDLADSISGDKIVDFEMHALLQLVCRSSRELVYISDAYSNLMQAECRRVKNKFDLLAESKKIKLSADERLNIKDDCADVLSVFVSIHRLVKDQNKIKASVHIDTIYRTQTGMLSSVRRGIEMETDYNCDNLRIKSMRLTDVYLRPDGQYIDGHLSLELNCVTCENIEIEKIMAVELNENEAICLENFPTVNLVRCADETLWELAKTYHSNIEVIKAYNEIGDDLCGKMLLIPKSI